MAAEQQLFFWLNGVLIQPLPFLFKKLTDHPNQKAEKYNIEIRLERVFEQLALGLLEEHDFFEQIRKELGVSIHRETFLEALSNAVQPNKKVYAIINRVPKKIKTWFIVDFPAAWLTQISTKLELHHAFPDDRILILPEIGLSKVSPDLFAFMAKRVHAPAENCLLIDRSAKRAVDALNFGLPSVIFVDAWRLEREFILRKIINKL